MLRFTQEHVWLRDDNGVVTVGFTPYGQEKLGEVIFVELPAAGVKLEAGAVAAIVESVKAASEIHAPIAGEIVAVNGRLVGEPGLLNSDPLGDGWLLTLKIANAAELSTLLDEAAYRSLIGSP